MIEDDLFDYAVSNVSFVDFGEGLSLLVFSTFEINNNDVKFYVLDEQPILQIHYPSDSVMSVTIEDEDVYNELKRINKIRIYEIDMVTGEMGNFYIATS